MGVCSRTWTKLSEHVRGVVGMAALLGLLVPGESAAEPCPVPLAPFEQMLGASYVAGAVSNGHVAATVTPVGGLASLRWPSTSHYEMLNFTTSSEDGARCLPRFGAADNEGVFAGIERAGSVTWLRDFDAHEAEYLSSDDNILVFRMSGNNGDEITETVWVDPDEDTLFFRYQLEPGGGLDVAKGVSYVNFASARQNDPLIPAEWLDSGEQDLFLWRDDVTGALVSASADGLEPTDLSELLEASGGWSVLRSVFDSATKPRFVALVPIGTSPDAFQVGHDAVDDPGNGWNAGADAFVAASAGEFPGDAAALGATNGALRLPLTTYADGSRGWVVALTFDDDPGALRDRIVALQGAGLEGMDSSLARTRDWWRSWIGRARLPNAWPEAWRSFAKRTLISIRSAYHPDSGAIVASLSTNPPYAFDWPRDGAYIGHLLELAGYTEMAEKHLEFYARVVRAKDGDQPTMLCGNSDPLSFQKIFDTCEPAGTFSMNYTSDGVPGGPIAYQIDQSGLALWAMLIHLNFIDDDAHAREYLKAIWPAVELIVENLVRCEDPDTGELCVAYQIDEPEPTRTEIGAFAVYAGLRAAIGAGESWQQVPRQTIERWRARLDRLGAAIANNHAYLQDAPAHLGKRPAYAGEALWPSGLLADRIVNISAEDQAAFMARMQATIGLDSLKTTTPPEWRAYDTKDVLAIALVRGRDHSAAEQTLGYLRLMLEEMPMVGTLHLGEAYIYADPKGGNAPRFVAGVAQPHVWQQTLATLAAWAYEPEERDRFFLQVRAPSTNEVGAGCGCRLAGGDGASDSRFALAFALLCIGWAAWRRRANA